ncbi:unnamed protein product, partial [Symbiodinium microadriaticum]
YGTAQDDRERKSRLLAGRPNALGGRICGARFVTRLGRAGSNPHGHCRRLCASAFVHTARLDHEVGRTQSRLVCWTPRRARQLAGDVALCQGTTSTCEGWLAAGAAPLRPSGVSWCPLPGGLSVAGSFRSGDQKPFRVG